MTKPNFTTMNLKDLRQYILSNREDNEAFYTFVDRVDTEKKWINNPPLDSIEDMDNYPDFLEGFNGRLPLEYNDNFYGKDGHSNLDDSIK